MTAETYSSKHQLLVNDILFARTGATVGKTYFYDGTIGAAIFAGYCIRFRIDNKKILPKYVYWCTKTNDYKKWVEGIQRPSGQPNINKEEYKSYEIPIPSPDTQNYLSSYLDEANNSRLNKLAQAKKIVSDAKNNVFVTIGIKFVSYSPSLFNYTRLRNIREYGIYCNAHSAYLNDVFKQMSSSRYYVGNLEEYIDVNPVTDRKLLRTDLPVTFVPMPAVEELTNHVEYEIKKYEEVKTGFTIFQRNDLLWAKITPCMQNGKSFIASDMPTDIGFGSTEFHVLRVKPDKENTVYMPYIWILLSENSILEAAQGMFSGSAGQQRVPDTFLRKFPLVLPPYPIQKELADNVVQALINAQNMKQEAENEWKEAILHFEKELMGGQR